MSKYSNTTFPELPEWDSETYPYAVVTLLYEKGSEDWKLANLFCSSEMFYFDYEDEFITCDATSHYRYMAGSVEDGWTDYGVYEVTPELTPGMGSSGYMRIWTNAEILHLWDGSVYLAAGEFTPVEVSRFNLESWLVGFGLGLAGKPLPIGPAQNSA